MNAVIAQLPGTPLDSMGNTTAIFVSESFELYYSARIDSPEMEKNLCTVKKTNHTQTGYEIFCHTKELFRDFLECCHAEGQNVLIPDSRHTNLESAREYANRHLTEIPSMLAYMIGGMSNGLEAAKKREFVHHMVYDVLHVISRQTYYSGSRLTWDLIGA